MSGLNFNPACRIATTFAVLAALAAPARAATKASTTTTTAVTNPYQVIVPKTFEYNTLGVVRGGAHSGTIKGPAQISFDGVSDGVYATGSGQSIQLGQFVVKPATTATGADANAMTTYKDAPFIIQVHAPGYDKTSKIPVLSAALPNFSKAFHLETHTINSLLIRGHLDGTVNGVSGSSVTATVDSVKLGTLAKVSKNYATNFTFPVRSSDLRLPTSWTMNTTGNALASTSATPAGTSTTTAAGMSTTTTSGASTTASNLTGTSSTALPASTAAQLLATPAAETLTTNASPLADPTPTPEPSTFVIFAVAAGGVAWARRRRAA